MLKPDEDGVTHINIYSKGKTEIGRWASNFQYAPIVIDDGHFDSVEGYFYWLGTRNAQLRFLSGFAAKKLGRESPDVIRLTEEEFQGKICNAITVKFNTYPEWLEKLKETDLPLAHYYVYGGLVRPAGYEWIVAHIDSLRGGGANIC